MESLGHLNVAVSLCSVAIPTDDTCPRTFSGVSHTSTDTAYSHLSYCVDDHRNRSETLFILTDVLTLSPEDTDSEEAHLISPDNVPSLVDTETQEDPDDLDDVDDSEGGFDDYVTVDLQTVYTLTDEEWEYLHPQDGLVPPPPSPRLFPRRANTMPLLQHPTSSIAIMALFTFMKPVDAAPDANENFVEQPLISWVPRKSWPVWTVLLAVGTASWFLLTPYLSHRQAVPQKAIASDAVIVPSVAPPIAVPLGGVAMERTRRTYGYPRSRPLELGEAANIPHINHRVGPRAARVATSMALFTPAVAASPASSVPRPAQSMQLSALAVAIPVALIAMTWAIRARPRVSTAASQPARRSHTTGAVWPAACFFALFLVPTAMAEPTFTLAENFEGSSQRMSPGTIAAIALGTAAILFVLPILVKVFGLLGFLVRWRACFQKTRIYQYACIAAGMTLGITVGLVLMPLFAVYMFAVFVAAVTASYGRWAGLDTSGWWQGQTTQWPSRLLHAAPSEIAPSGIDPFETDSRLVTPFVTPISPVDKGKSDILRQYTDAVPLPVYPPRTYARSIELAVPRFTSTQYSPATPTGASVWDVA
ncbi:uncharacterized protein CcaverHIS019_0105960 [Cutaneotrichosporon cavernicola]|uniref:Transmembrane protein n=1 Tax=Cutaneotrichosporon cavernicola TaxID=279322 RepID=A0AA48L218_9TREE|nr:uncharacterized protein CcaverHIS019_0105960 [Cutaneotrichosporon cavernicola]BEI87878.1 hypothetical protein CcaverHIS019_0105960 [Cutaneotrichosporon cavernicola]BEI95652.1 hypothetical protein CcaverHIS631_0106010 [Cutaneotrichosporon cavernicola]